MHRNSMFVVKYVQRMSMDAVDNAKCVEVKVFFNICKGHIFYMKSVLNCQTVKNKSKISSKISFHKFFVNGMNVQNFTFFCFSEYLFLLTILIKPQSGFKIAFAMLDQDGNERIDREEFRVKHLLLLLM